MVVSLLCALALTAGPDAPGPVVLSQAGLEAAARYSREQNGLSLVVLQGDRIVYEEYRDGDPSRPAFLASCVKSLWGLAAAAAAHDGLLSFDEPVADTLTEWRDDPRRARIRIRDLLTMTSGLDPGYAPLYETDPEDAFAVAVGLPAVGPVGESFVYGPANLEAFGAVLERKLARRGMSPVRYLEKRVLEPIGSGYASWTRDQSGRVMMSSGASMTARQLLAVGQLIARQGMWGRRRVIAADKLAALMRGTSANPAYGMSFWLNANAARPDAVEVDYEKALGAGPGFDWNTACVSRLAPPDLVLMMGSWNQRVYVVPSQRLVIVRQGGGADFTDNEFWARLLQQPQQG